MEAKRPSLQTNANSFASGHRCMLRMLVSPASLASGTQFFVSAALRLQLGGIGMPLSRLQLVLGVHLASNEASQSEGAWFYLSVLNQT